jgi:asparagine synthase (glutamine-hydrolysing)
MCGISGIVSFDQKRVDEDRVRVMMQKMKHRGPNDEGTFFHQSVGLGFVRLSILDLSAAGHQPMHDESGRYTIVFNGEIFNYIELREELIALGHRFKSQTDTEVLLHSYMQWGTDFLHRLNGMWAFAIYDSLSGKLFCARDRYGIKPFYYYQSDNEFIFASEIKSILPLIEGRQVNEKSMFDYIIYNRTDHSNETFFSNINKLLHGHYLVIENNQVTITRWYNLKERIQPRQISPQEYLDLFVSSVQLRLRSDVPIGVSLSGGIDSSSIASVLSKRFGLSKLNTFSAVYPGDPNDESEFINLYKTELKNMHFVSPSADTFWNDYQEFVEAHNEPVNDVGSYVQYKVMELATQFVTVTLDGQGSDEQLGGYHNFFGSYYRELLTTGKWMSLVQENMAYLKHHHSVNALKYFAYFMMPSGVKSRVSKAVYGDVSPEFYDRYKDVSTIQRDLYSPANLRDALVMHFEHKLEHLLKWEDLNSMHFSIESRVPFLDYRFVETTLSLPSSCIIKDGTTKYILRQAMKGVLPEPIRMRQDKKGFANPRAKWFCDDRFKGLINDIIDSSSFHNLGYFNVDDCKRKYASHLKGEGDMSKDIWKWINIYTWHQKYVK